MEPKLKRFERMQKLMRAATPHQEIHRLLEPEMSQLDVDNAMLSLMDVDREAKPRAYADKAWGRACGLVEERYGAWLRPQRGL